MTVEYQVTDVTPAMADKWLTTANTHNRNMRSKRVQDYARDMRTGSWVENGDAIRFAEDGTLLDGQHRLAAILEADVTIRMLVVSGLANTAQDTVDDGVRRTLHDVLGLKGETNTTVLASVLRRAYLWQSYPERRPRGFDKSIRPTNAEALDMLRRHPELRASVREASAAAQHIPLTKSALGLFHWLALKIDPADCADFMDQLKYGDGLRSIDPVFQLRKRAQMMRRQTGRESEHVYFALIAKAWNLYRDGATIEILSYRGGGMSAERFPEPK
jgi:hypothetical protein